MDMEQIRTRILAMNSDLEMCDKILESKATTESMLWSINAQLELEHNQNKTDLENLTAQKDNFTKKMENANTLLTMVKEKLLRSMGKM